MPGNTVVVTEDLIKPLVDWMTEREQIYLRRQAGEPQEKWTDDPIFKNNHFCNVFREQDRVTVWIRKNIREPFAKHPKLWWMLCMARQINWPDTLEELMVKTNVPHQFHPDTMVDIMRERSKRGDKVYTGAYMLTCPTISIDKPDYTVNHVLAPLWSDELDAEIASIGTIEAMTKHLQQFHGFGPFLAYEVATDLRHTDYLRNAPDIHTWANPGPGCHRGLNRLFGRGLNEKVKVVDAVAEMKAIQDLFIKHGWEVEMRDIEHSLCETDKYLRVKEGHGKMRSGFKPREEETKS